VLCGWYCELGNSEEGSGKTALVGFTDSDFAGDVDSRKNTSSVFFFLNESPVTWQSTK
jgi:hypothetical protein